MRGGRRICRFPALQHDGAQVRQEVPAELMGQSYRDAVAQENLNPVARPRIEPVAAADGKNFAFVATFEVLPEVRLKGLDKIRVSRPEVDTDADATTCPIRSGRLCGHRTRIQRPFFVLRRPMTQ
jgi:trigger factor